MNNNFELSVQDAKTAARAGRLHTAHGIVETHLRHVIAYGATAACTEAACELPHRELAQGGKFGKGGYLLPLLEALIDQA